MTKRKSFNELGALLLSDFFAFITEIIQITKEKLLSKGNAQDVRVLAIAGRGCNVHLLL